LSNRDPLLRSLVPSRKLSATKPSKSSLRMPPTQVRTQSMLRRMIKSWKSWRLLSMPPFRCCTFVSWHSSGNRP
jgi:hypothetical protein